MEVSGGDGGDGIVSLHREKRNPKGGPDGGDGGAGGAVILVADPHMASLIDFEHRPRFRAEHGQAGKTNLGTGRSGKPLMVRVPVGSVVYNAETGEMYGDLTEPGQELVVALGGAGGRGNAYFRTPSRQTPRFCERGERGERAVLRIELKLLADIGLVGLPNAGKSSLLARVSAARPKIAPYPFTTLRPVLGVYRVEEGESYVVADVPGLIEGAHRGTGLGDKFLRHLERTRVLVHLIDASLTERMDPLADYEVIRAELAAFGRSLSTLPSIVALTKMDIADREIADDIAGELRRRGCEEVHCISAATGEGLSELMGSAVTRIRALLREHPREAPARRTMRPDPPVRPLSVERLDSGVFRVSGTEVERLVGRFHLNNDEAVLHLHRELVRIGVLDKLEAAGAAAGDTVCVGEVELHYADAADVYD